MGESVGQNVPSASDWARVSAHEHLTRYRRLGAGCAVVVLAAPGALEDGPWRRSASEDAVRELLRCVGVAP